jgi:NADH:ubiquinone oxidoreductase subunit 6 (subunit J)
MTCQAKEALYSYLRTAAIAMASVYIALNGEVFDKAGIQALIYAGIVAVAGPAARALNPHDPAFGKLVAPEQSEEH